MADNKCCSCTCEKPKQPECKVKPVMLCQTGCGCVGYGYVPVQELEKIYDVDKAIVSGTVFPELDLDICEYGCICKKWGGTDDDE